MSDRQKLQTAAELHFASMGQAYIILEAFSGPLPLRK